MPAVHSSSYGMASTGSSASRRPPRSLPRSTGSLATAHSPSVSAARAAPSRRRSPGTVSSSNCLADPSSVSIAIPAMNEADAIGTVVSSLRAAAPWREVLVVDDGSTDETSARARAAGACIVRHPYNKGNGAAVKTGIRRANGDFVLIIDADGQHPPEDAQR